MILEIAVASIEACLIANQAGAHRIELCDNLVEGGTTPSIGAIKTALKHCTADVFVMIRPRGGDFIYSQSEFETMQYDIELCKDLGVKGIVLGLLNLDASVDTTRTTALVKLAKDMQVTFHRAFDRTANYKTALQQIIDTGCNRLLTSGTHPTVLEGINELQEIIELAKQQLIIMPGSGVRSNNLQQIKSLLPTTEFHSSASKLFTSKIQTPAKYFKPHDGEYTLVCENEIKGLLAILKGE
jgi:copper homeostasis protein